MQNAISKVNSSSTFSISPISHATLVMELSGQTIYIDPVGGESTFSVQKDANIVLITDIHGDHFDPKTLKSVVKENTTTILPQAVKNQLEIELPGKIIVLKNGDKLNLKGIIVEAIPMYNFPESEDAYHVKGRGNGYIVESKDKRVYIAGDTGNIPEMSSLRDIDVAFVPMNLPYTMRVEDAAQAVVAFKPKVVHPYHYRGQDGFSDIEKFKKLVNEKDPNINVELLNFYP